MTVGITHVDSKEVIPWFSWKAVLFHQQINRSMVLLYMVTWIPSIYPLYVSIYIPAPWILWDRYIIYGSYGKNNHHLWILVYHIYPSTMDPSWEQIKVTIDLGPRARANSAATLLRQTAMPLPRSCRMASRGSHVCHDSPYHLSWRKIHMELVVSTYPKRMVFHQL